MAVEFGVYFFPTDYAVDPGELARMLEARGFGALLFAEHTHIPVSRDTPYPPGGDLPPEYWHTYDPFVACMASAAATERLKVGTGICLVTERDPITTAKEVASVDRLSGGRFLFGVGAGWNLEEMRNHGTDPSRRFRLMRERVEAMKTIWKEDEAAYHGELVDFDPVWSWPKPVQQPHPPIIVGGNGPKAPDRALAYGDEWMPNHFSDAERVQARIRDFIARGEQVGRGRLGVTVYGGPSRPDAIEGYAAAGVTRYLFRVESLERGAVEQRLDHLADVVAQFRGSG
jgi:probable F420-dependent oxidoreductase